MQPEKLKESTEESPLRACVEREKSVRGEGRDQFTGNGSQIDGACIVKESTSYFVPVYIKWKKPDSERA